MRLVIRDIKNEFQLRGIVSLIHPLDLIDVIVICNEDGNVYTIDCADLAFAGHLNNGKLADIKINQESPVLKGFTTDQKILLISNIVRLSKIDAIVREEV